MVGGGWGQLCLAYEGCEASNLLEKKGVQPNLKPCCCRMMRESCKF